MSLKNNDSNTENCKFSKSLLIYKRRSVFHRIYYWLVSIPFIYRYKTNLKYLSLSLFGEIVDFVLFFILTSIFDVFYIISAVISYLAGTFTNFNLHKYFTFKYSTNNFWKLLSSFFKYSMVSITGLIVTLILISIFIELFGLYSIIAKLFASIIVFFLNYTGHSNILTSPKIFKTKK